MIVQLGCLAFAYLTGSIPFGVFLARAQGIDIMKVGSGNIGATNVYRTLGRGPGLLVFLLDVLKGAIPSALAWKWTGDRSFAFCVGIVAVLGHSFSPWLKFRGGKGVATGLGALIGSSPIVAGLALGLFLTILVVVRYLSIAAMVAALSLFPMSLALGEPKLLLVGTAALGLFILWRHRPNIARLRAGTEPKFDFRGGNARPSTDVPGEPHLEGERP